MKPVTERLARVGTQDELIGTGQDSRSAQGGGVEVAKPRAGWWRRSLADLHFAVGGGGAVVSEHVIAGAGLLVFGFAG